MSNNKTSIKNKHIKSNSEKYTIFNDFLRNLENYKSIGYLSDLKNETNCLSNNKINLSKYTKIDGSKNFLLGTINSIISKDDLTENLNNVKTIIDNLEFISSNSKYINNIQHQQNSSSKCHIKNNDLFSFSSPNIPQKNKFLINRKNENLNPDNNNIIIKENNNKNDLDDNEYNFLYLSNNLESNEYQKEINNKEKLDYLNINDTFNLKNSNATLYRQDYYVKQFKVQYSIWLRNYLNQKLKLLIIETKNCRKHLKFYPLNSLKFTANPKYEDNKYFLSLKIKEILTVGIDGPKSSNQKKNKENIEIIENNIYKQNTNANPDLLNFLNSTMEDSIRIFYQSDQFKKFKNSDQAKLNDLKFIQEKNFSLLKENGFVYLIKNYKGNSKSSISFRSS